METHASRPVFSDSPRGATVKTTYVEREVKVLAVFDTEVDAISSLNAQATVFFSVGAGLISLAGGIWTTAVFSEKLTAAGQVATDVGAPVLGALSLIFFGLALWAWWKRRSALNTIKKQSRSGIQ